MNAVRIAELAARLDGLGLRVTWHTGRCLLTGLESTAPVERADGLIEFGPAVLDPLHAQQYAIDLFHFALDAAERQTPGAPLPLPLFEQQEVRRG